MRTQIITPHDQGCVAMKHFKEGHWITPWSYINSERTIYGTQTAAVKKSGEKFHRRRQKYRWLVIGCNSISCLGEIAVREHDILQAITKETK